jgi:hypothetical protein
MKIALLLASVFIIGSAVCSAQAPQKGKAAGTAAADSRAVRSSPAYSEVLLRRTELESELESLLIDFTEEYPKIKSTRFSLEQLQKQMDVLLAVKPADASKLTLALGRLMVRKVELDSELWALQENLADGHPDVKRAKRKVEIFENAIKEILG